MPKPYLSPKATKSLQRAKKYQKQQFNSTGERVEYFKQLKLSEVRNLRKLLSPSKYYDQLVSMFIDKFGSYPESNIDLYKRFRLSADDIRRAEKSRIRELIKQGHSISEPNEEELISYTLKRLGHSMRK